MSAVKFHPLTPPRWADYEALFGRNGAYGGCWCMWWRLTRAQFEDQKGEGNRRAMKVLVDSGVVPGILAYVDGRPAGWCSVAPREDFGSLERSPILKRLDEQPVWSIVCFFVGRPFRGRGLLSELVSGAVMHVRENGGRIVEAYPTVPRGRVLPPVSSYMGVPSVFTQAGFFEVSRPSKSRAILRYQIA